MQQVFEQLIKGFVPKLSKADKQCTARLRAENKRILRELKSECSEEVFLKISKARQTNLDYCRQDLKDIFCEGVLYGILTGLETACGFPGGKSLLSSLIEGNTCDKRSPPSQKTLTLEQRYGLLYNDLQKELTTKLLLKADKVLDNDACIVYLYVRACYAAGMRKGIPLGIAAGEFAETLPLS